MSSTASSVGDKRKLEDKTTDLEPPTKKPKLQDLNQTKNEQNLTEIPSVTTVRESVILDHNIEWIWTQINDCRFHYLSTLKSSEMIPDQNSSLSVGTNRKLYYNDGTTQTIQVNEISVSPSSRKVSYSVITSEPSVTYSSALHSIEAIPITYPGNKTFLSWETCFSNDATITVIQDSRFKKKEAFNDLQNALVDIKNT